MVNYELGKIYKIKCNITGDIYIGSTCQPTLAQRLSGHVAHHKHYKKTGKGRCVTSYKILDNGDYHIVLLESVKCESSDELKARERYHIENNECINKTIPLRTTKEWHCENKEHIRAYQKKYREANKEQIKEANKEQINEYQRRYKEANKEKIKEYQRQYRAKKTQEQE